MTLHLKGNRRAVRFERFGYGIARPDMLPKRFATRRIQRQKKGFSAGLTAAVYRLIALKHFEVKLSFVEQRRGPKSPLKCEFAIILRDTPPPKFLSGVIEAARSPLP